jgi:hypothetical protein
MSTKKVKPIFVITTMKFGYKYGSNTRSKDGTYHSFYKRTSPNQRKYFTIVRERTWGWYPTIEQAKEAVEHNFADLYEDGYYPQAVIEEMHAGVLHGCVTPREWWYQWKGSPEKGAYKPWQKPKEYDKVIGFMNRMRHIRADWRDVNED